MIKKNRFGQEFIENLLSHVLKTYVKRCAFCVRERKKKKWERERERRRNVSWLEGHGRLACLWRNSRGEFEIMLRQATASPVGDASDRIPTETDTRESQALSQSKNKWADL